MLRAAAGARACESRRAREAVMNCPRDKRYSEKQPSDTRRRGAGVSNQGNPMASRSRHRSVRILFAFCLLLAVSGGVAQDRDDPPELPPGLAPAGSGQQPDESPDEPALPAGLGGEQQSRRATGESDAAEPPAGFVDSLTGFWDLRAGVRLRDDPNQRSTSLGEARLQLSRDSYFGN